jgi:hypothetical protein
MYIITSKTRRVMQRDPRFQAAAKQETSAILRECGVQRAQPLAGQSTVEQLEQVKANKSKIADSMAASKEQNRKQQREKAKQREQQTARMFKTKGKELAEKHRAGVLGKV